MSHCSAISNQPVFLAVLKSLENDKARGFKFPQMQVSPAHYFLAGAEMLGNLVELRNFNATRS